jgi:hypothetical protein
MRHVAARPTRPGTVHSRTASRSRPAMRSPSQPSSASISDVGTRRAPSHLHISAADTRSAAMSTDPLSASGLAARLTALGLYYSPVERVLICIQCKYALQPSADAASRHLGAKHSIPAEARRGLAALVRSLDLPDPNTVASRPDGSAPHPHLAVRTPSVRDRLRPQVRRLRSSLIGAGLPELANRLRAPLSFSRQPTRGRAGHLAYACFTWGMLDSRQTSRMQYIRAESSVV